MFRLKLTLTGFVFFLLAGYGFSDDYLLEVAGIKYTAADLQAVMQSNGFDLPDQAVQKLQRDAVIASLGKNENDLYMSAFGENLELENARVNARDLPLISKKAGARKFMFENWLGERSHKVPVKYLTMDKYWDMVKQTKSYQVRAEAGQKLSADQIAYTAIELALPNQQVLALKNKQDYLKGSEYNSYINDNYSQIYDFVKRSKTLAQIQNYLITKITGEKIAAETIDPELLAQDELEIERRADGYIKEHMLDDPLDFTGSDFSSPSDMMDSLYSRYSQKHAVEISNLKNIFGGKTDPKNESPAIQSYVSKTKIAFLKTGLANRLTDPEVRDWMSKNKFPGSYSEARFVVSNLKYEERLTQVLKENGISMNLLKE